MLSHHPVIRWL